MIFDFQRSVSAPTSELLPGVSTDANLVVPRTGPLTNRAPTMIAFAFRSNTASNGLNISVHAMVESSDDTNAVDNFAEVQTRDRQWVLIDAFTLNHGNTLRPLPNITPGRYFVQITGGDAAAGGTILAAFI